MNDEPVTVERGESSQVLIADDHPLFRDALRRILDEEPGLEVVGEAGDGLEALQMCRRLRPDLVLMDVGMPNLDGLEATRVIKQELPLTVVLVITALQDLNLLAQALKAGAGGYILKHGSPQSILEAIRAALSGESPLDQELAGDLLRLLDEAPRGEKSASIAPYLGEDPSGDGGRSSPLELLSPRELEVLWLMVEGRTNGQIAESLRVSVSTVKKHVRQVLAKMEVSDRVQAVVRAMELGVRPEQEV